MISMNCVMDSGMWLCLLRKKKNNIQEHFGRACFFKLHYRKEKALDSVIYERILLVSCEFNEIGKVKP